MAKRISETQIGKTMVGRILSFDRIRGYGFIRASTEEDIFLSSYYVPKNVWKKLSVGDYVEFVVSRNGDTNHVMAGNTTITKKMPKELSITLPDHGTLATRHIYQFGKGSLIKEGYGELYPNYPVESFDYVFIRTAKRSFVFNRNGSPVIIDGETDVEEFYQYLTDLLTKYDIDRNYESF